MVIFTSVTFQLEPQIQRLSKVVSNLMMVTDLFEKYDFSAALFKLVFFSSSATCPWSAFCEVIQSKSNQITAAISKEG